MYTPILEMNLTTVNNIIKTPRITGLLFFMYLLLVQSFLCDVALAETKNKKEITPDKKTESVTDKETTNKQFQDWIYQCGGEGLKDEQCFIMQNIFIQESGLRLLSLAVGYLGPDDSPWLFLTAPLGIFLPAGMVFNVDGGEEYKTPVRVCLPDGCKASITLDKKLIWALKKGKQAKVAFLDGNTQKQITVEVSLAGFSRGFGALGTKRK